MRAEPLEQCRRTLRRALRRSFARIEIDCENVDVPGALGDRDVARIEPHPCAHAAFYESERGIARAREIVCDDVTHHLRGGFETHQRPDARAIAREFFRIAGIDDPTAIEDVRAIRHF